VGPNTTSGFEFRQSSFTPREQVLRMPCPTTLSDMHRLPGMLGLLQLSPPDMPVTQELLLSSSCLQQGYHNAPHGAHRTGLFQGILALQVLSSSSPVLRTLRCNTGTLPSEQPWTPSPCPGHYPRHLSTTGPLSPYGSRRVGDPMVSLLCRSTFRHPIRWLFRSLRIVGAGHLLHTTRTFVGDCSACPIVP
jgi:hypothetical protein